MRVEDERFHYHFIPAQPGYEVISLNWYIYGDVESYYLQHRAAIIAWRVQTENYEGHNIICGAEPVWVGGEYFGEAPAILAPDRSVYYGSYRFNGLRDYSVWDWIMSASKSENKEHWRDSVRKLIEQEKDNIDALSSFVHEEAAE